MKCCKILFSKILETKHSLFDDIPWREEMICMSDTLVLIVDKSVPANYGIVYWTMAWSVQLQLDEGGENT